MLRTSAALSLFLLSSYCAAQPGYPVPPPPAPLPAAVSQSSAKVDEVLSRIESNLYAGDAADEQAAEQSLNRLVNMNRSVAGMIQPVGFASFNQKKYAFLKSGEGALVRVAEGDALGSVKIERIQANGISYTLNKKRYFAPIAYFAVEPKAPAKRNDNEQEKKEGSK